LIVHVLHAQARDVFDDDDAVLGFSRFNFPVRMRAPHMARALVTHTERERERNVTASP
jgi:hypothetical protein